LEIIVIRKLLCLLVSMLICVSMTLPVMAEESLFIPSYGLEAKKAEMNGEDVLDCVVVTSVTEAKEKTTDITQEERDLLVEVYDALSDGTMALPAEGQCVELLDLSFALACRENADHNRKAEALKEAGATLTVDFELEIENHDQLLVFVYIDGKWEPVEQVSANGDGIVTVTFEDICPVLFLAPGGDDQGEVDLPNYPPEFVPSITYKDGPVIDMAEMDGEGVEDCVVVTTIKQAEEKSTDISQEDRDLLLEVYEKLEEGSMTLPLEKEGYVVRELVDVSFEYEDCRQIEEHGHKDENLKKEGVTLTVTFDLGIGTFEDLIVMAYVDGEWTPIKSVENNGDGTVTCVFEDICPVAFIVKEGTNNGNPTTGDAMGSQMALFVGMMVLSAAGIVMLTAAKARKMR
jgi:hypothetical protein